MKPIDEETLRWNRRNATILGAVSIAILVVIIYSVFELVPKGEDPTYPLLFSGLVYLPIVFVASRIWVKWRRRQREKELAKKV